MSGRGGTGVEVGGSVDLGVAVGVGISAEVADGVSVGVGVCVIVVGVGVGVIVSFGVQLARNSPKTSKVTIAIDQTLLFDRIGAPPFTSLLPDAGDFMPTEFASPVLDVVLLD